ncbi:MAG: sugar MFS transporter [Bacteroidales bacterium]|nr:sugar MFS transporter [Bacteroidales bacterium]
MENRTLNKKLKQNSPIIIIGLLFFIFGFFTWLNATLIPFLRTACELSSFEAYLVTFAFYISYFVMALPSSKVLEKVGFKRGMSLGLIIMAIGTLIFVPAALTRIYFWFLAGLFVQGTGLAILQTAANPYVTILGPIESAAKRISIMGVANKLAGILSPIILGTLILKGIDKFSENLTKMTGAEKTAALNTLADKVMLPYIVSAVVLIIMAVLIIVSSLPEIEAQEEPTDDKTTERHSILQFPYFWYGVIALFFYTGAEVVSVDTLINYGLSLGFNIDVAKFFSSFTLIAMIIGYFIGIISIPKYISQQKALGLFAVLGVISTIVAISTHGYVSVLFVALLGFVNSIMWPAIWPLSIDGLGKFTKKGSAFLIMAIAGGATIPLLYGYLSGLKSVGSTHAYAILIICYLVIFYFATYGSKIGKHPSETTVKN